MSSVQSNDIFDKLAAAPLGLIMAYSEEGEIETLSTLFREGVQGVQNAHGEIYNNLRQPGTLMGRIIYELEHPRAFELIPDGYSEKLQEVKKRVINCLLQNELLMKRIWAPVLGGRQIDQLSYHEWNELGRLLFERLPLNELFMQEIWAPVLDGRQIREISYPERNELEWLLREQRDQDLVTFAEGLRQLCPFIGNFLKTIDNLKIAEKAEKLRSWMRTPEIKAKLAEIDEFPQIHQLIERVCPPETLYLLFIYYGASILASFLRKRDVAGIRAFALHASLSSLERNNSELARVVLLRTVDLGDLQLFMKLRENNAFADINNTIFEDVNPLDGMDPGGQNGPQAEHIAVMRAAIELPTIGLCFLWCLLSVHISNQEWENVGELLNHSKIDEFSTRPLPAIFLEPFISHLEESRDKCQQGGQPYLASRFQEIIDRRSGQ